MLSGEPLAARALHQASGRNAIWARSSDDADVAVALLHDDTEDDALVDANLGCFYDGVPA